MGPHPADCWPWGLTCVSSHVEPRESVSTCAAPHLAPRPRLWQRPEPELGTCLVLAIRVPCPELCPSMSHPSPPHPTLAAAAAPTSSMSAPQRKDGEGAETQPPRPAPVWLRCISLCGFAHDRRFGVCRAQGHGCYPAAGVPGMWLLACGKGAPEGQPGPRAAARRAGRGGGSGPCLHGEPGRCVVSDRWMLKVAISAVEQGSRGKGAVGGAGSFV